MGLTRPRRRRAAASPRRWRRPRPSPRRAGAAAAWAARTCPGRTAAPTRPGAPSNPCTAPSGWPRRRPCTAARRAGCCPSTGRGSAPDARRACRRRSGTTPRDIHNSFLFAFSCSSIDRLVHSQNKLKKTEIFQKKKLFQLDKSFRMHLYIHDKPGETKKKVKKSLCLYSLKASEPPWSQGRPKTYLNPINPMEWGTCRLRSTIQLVSKSSSSSPNGFTRLSATFSQPM